MPVKKPHYDIMLSSTFKELKEHRAAILDAINRVQLYSPAMEYDSALPADVITASLNKVKVADAYVGLMPAALLNNTGLPRPGVTHKQLTGLDPSDAEDMLRQVGIQGDSAEIRRYLDKNFGCHPLVVGVVGGLIRNYAPAPCNFDVWSEDPDAGGSTNVVAMDLVQNRNHILKFAFDELDADSRTLLARIALVSESVDYETSVALNPRRPEAPKEVAKPYSWQGDYDQRKTEYETYLQELESWRNSPAPGLAKQWLNSALKDLESRGLLQWDHQNGKYDLHPVVRGYAVSSLAPERREQVAQPIIDYFSLRPDIEEEDAQTIHDVRNGLQVARTLLHVGKFSQAADGINYDLAPALLFNLEAYEEFLSLVRPFFPNGWVQQPRYIDGQAFPELWACVAIAVFGLEGGPRARPIFEGVVSSYMALDSQSGVLTALRSLCRCCGPADRARLSDLLSQATSVLGSDEEETMSCLSGMGGSTNVGDFVAAERHWAEFDANPRPEKPRSYRPGYGEYRLARLRLLEGRLEEELLARAESIATAGNNRRAVRDLCRLRGEWMLSVGRHAEAATAFEGEINLRREVNLNASDSEARLALAEAKLGQTAQAIETANRLSVLENPPHLELAELKLELRDTAGARHHIVPAYRDAWADGPPYVYWWQLRRARAALAALGDPEPELPPCDPSKIKPFPFEAELESYLEKKKAEKEAAEAEEE